MRIAAVVAFAVFALSMAVQWNDPDPWAWLAVYAAPAALAVAVGLGRSHAIASGALLALYLGLFAVWSPSLARLDREAVSQIGMRSVEAEEAREAGGIALCLAWCAIAFAHDWRRRRTGAR